MVQRSVRWLAAGLIVAAVALVASPAHAKGPDQVTIEGPGIDDAIVVRGDWTLAEQTGWVTAVWGEPATGMSTSAPAGDLGAAYTMTWRLPMGSDVEADYIHQTLYPFAPDGPVVHTEPGQPFYGSDHTVGGWYQADASLRSFLQRVGIPSEPVEVAPVRPDGGSNTSPLAIAGRSVAAAAAIAVAALVAVKRAARRRPEVAAT
jgi:hypothetical protein